MTSRRTRRRLGWKSVTIALLALAGFYFSRGYFQRFTKTYPANAFYEVKRADMLISIVEDGALRALNETVVRSGLEGLNRIIYLVPEGSYVQKGDLLVELDTSGLKDRLNEQELSYQQRLLQMLQATGNLNIQKNLTESQLKDAELKVENAQSDLEKYRDGDAPLLIKTIEARSGVLAEQVRIATERYARTQDLFKNGSATRSELEADALSLKREQLALSQYQEDLRLVIKYDQPNQVRLLQSNLEQAKAELARLKQRTSNEIAQAEADLKTSQSTLEFLDESLKTQRRRLDNAKIVAPQNGLVVYAAVSQFQFAGNSEDRRREEFRLRMGRGGGGGGRGGEGGSGEFRGGGRRGGGRSSLESTSTGSSGSGGSSRSSTAETIASGNQRIASAISGSSVTESTSGSGSGASTGGGSAGGGSSGGGRSGSGGSGGGTSGGQNASSSAAGSFASYGSMRPSSAFGGSSASSNSAASTAGSSAAASSSSASTSAGGQGSAPYSIANQFSSRSSLQSFSGFGDFGSFDFFGTPGILEEGTMVRQRQELIRLPDVSKMLAEIKVEEARVAQVRPGMTAYVRVQNVPHRRFKGTVRRVAPLPDSQSSWMNPNLKVYPTDILVEDELPVLKPGVSASAEVIITNLTKVLSVPRQTVVRFDGENVCFIKKGSRITPVPVTTGWFNDSFVEITSGLKEGDFVLLAPVSDEDIEEAPSEGTNAVESATNPRSSQPSAEPPAEERRFQRGNQDSIDGGPPTERRRGRGSFSRRPQGSQDAPE